MKEIKETHQQGSISIENIPNQALGVSISLEGDLGIQVAKDGRLWICINGIAFLRFKPKGMGSGGKKCEGKENSQ